MERLAAAGWLSGRSRVAEFASPHGGSWLGLLADRGLTPVADGGPADLVIDSFGMMHDADQSAALAERVARVAPGGILLLQYHSLGTIIRLGQWNALRHGHFAYYSTSALVGMLEANGFIARTAWRFDLYGGTVLLAASREPGPRSTHDRSVLSSCPMTPVSEFATLSASGACRVTPKPMPRGFATGSSPSEPQGKKCAGLRCRIACGRALCRAGVDRRLLPAIVDTSAPSMGSACRGRTFPSSSPATLATHPPHVVLLFVPDLLTEVRRAFPEVEESGGRWVDAEALARDDGSVAYERRLQFEAQLTAIREREPAFRPIFWRGVRDSAPSLAQCSRSACSAARRSPCTGDRHRPSASRAGAGNEATAARLPFVSLCPAPPARGRRREALACHQP